MEEEAPRTKIMVAVNESSIKGYPHASISSRAAFDWTLEKIIRSNTSDFVLLFLHVQVPDEDGRCVPPPVLNLYIAYLIALKRLFFSFFLGF